MPSWKPRFSSRSHDVMACLVVSRRSDIGRQLGIRSGRQGSCRWLLRLRTPAHSGYRKKRAGGDPPPAQGPMLNAKPAGGAGVRNRRSEILVSVGGPEWMTRQHWLGRFGKTSEQPLFPSSASLHKGLDRLLELHAAHLFQGGR